MKTFEHDDSINLEDIILEELCMKHEIDVSCSSLKLVDPTSLRLIELAPYLSTFYPSVNCDHFSDAPKSSLALACVLTYFPNNWTRNFDKSKWALTCMDEGVSLCFSHIHSFKLCFKLCDSHREL